MIEVQLTNEQAVILNALYDAGVFGVHNGKVTLNFDADGTLTDIDCNVKLYKRGYPPMHTLTTIVQEDTGDIL